MANIWLSRDELSARATQELAIEWLKKPQRGHLARFEAPELADIVHASVPGFYMAAKLKTVPSPS